MPVNGFLGTDSSAQSSERCGRLIVILPSDQFVSPGEVPRIVTLVLGSAASRFAGAGFKTLLAVLSKYSQSALGKRADAFSRPPFDSVSTWNAPLIGARVQARGQSGNEATWEPNVLAKRRLKTGVHFVYPTLRLPSLPSPWFSGLGDDAMSRGLRPNDPPPQ